MGLELPFICRWLTKLSPIQIHQLPTAYLFNIRPNSYSPPPDPYSIPCHWDSTIQPSRCLSCKMKGILDVLLSLAFFMQSLNKTCWFHLLNVSGIHPLLSIFRAALHFDVSSPVGPHNKLLIGLSVPIFIPLQYWNQISHCKIHNLFWSQIPTQWSASLACVFITYFPLSSCPMLPSYCFLFYPVAS